VPTGTSTPPDTFVVWYLVMHRDNTPFSLLVADPTILFLKYK
jgi:hypothetical protein